MLYLIESGNYGKIGFTENSETLNRRLISYNTHNPDFRFIGTTEGDKNVEKHLQKEYLASGNEWGNLDLVRKVWKKYKDNPDKYKRTVKGGYQQLLKDYIQNPSESYELEYPEFKDITTYLKESEMNTLRWNKEKLMKAVQDKKQLNKVFIKIHRTGFISNADLKALFQVEFIKHKIDLAPKATLIEECTLYTVEKKKKKIDGKTVSGYELGGANFRFKPSTINQ